jgi:hypothetical protein
VIVATHRFQKRSLNFLDENGNEGCAFCGRPRAVHPEGKTATGVAGDRNDPRLVSEQVSQDLLRAVLEAVCVRDGLSLESTIEPGEPARNYELAERLGIGHVFGLREQS